jgi:hypothetical protein
MRARWLAAAALAALTVVLLTAGAPAARRCPFHPQSTC